MANAVAPNGHERHIRAIVFKEGDKLVAQCLEYDIATQADDMGVLFDRLHLTIEAEFAACEAEGQEPKACITPAPNYYFEMWEKRSAALTPVLVDCPKDQFELQYAMAA